MDWINFPEHMGFSNYEIKKDGLIRNKKNKYVLTFTKKDYLYVRLTNNSKSKTYAVHILIAKVFIENPENKPTVDHIDRNPHNCHVDNLRWATQKEQNKNQIRPKNMAGCKIKQYDLNGNFIKEWDSISEACKVLKIDKSCIIAVCRGRQKSSNGFIWKYSDHIDINQIDNNLWKKFTYKNKEIYVSKEGNIANITGRIYKPHIKNGYYFVKSARVHRIVASAFLPNPNNLSVVNHKDGNKLNNKVDNLEWCTQKDNMIHFNENNEIKKDNRQRKVYEFDNDGNLIKVFNSLAEVCKTYNMKHNTLKYQCQSIYQKRFSFSNML